MPSWIFAYPDNQSLSISTSCLQSHHQSPSPTSLLPPPALRRPKFHPIEPPMSRWLRNLDRLVPSRSCVTRGGGRMAGMAADVARDLHTDGGDDGSGCREGPSH
eukprot:768667-Hanusia_phi.AAC.6